MAQADPRRRAGRTAEPNAAAAAERIATRPASTRWAGAGRAAGRDGARRQRAAGFGDPPASASRWSRPRDTMDSLRALHERLGIIDNAHKNLTDLTTQVTTLRDVLANKQSRGAFGQARMEAIVQDGMPKGAYEFQYTLSTGQAPGLRGVPARPAAAVHRREIPAGGDDRVARRAQRRGEEASPAQRLRADVMKHVTDIAEKYLDRRRDPGDGADVRAVGIGLCRDPRRLRRRDPEGLPRPRGAGVAVAADAGDPGDAADPEGRADARRRRPDPHRGDQCSATISAACATAC